MASTQDLYWWINRLPTILGVCFASQHKVTAKIAVFLIAGASGASTAAAQSLPTTYVACIAQRDLLNQQLDQAHQSRRTCVQNSIGSSLVITTRTSVVSCQPVRQLSYSYSCEAEIVRVCRISGELKKLHNHCNVLKQNEAENEAKLSLLREGASAYAEEASVYGLSTLDNPLAKNASPLAFAAEHWRTVSNWGEANSISRLSFTADSLNAITARNPLSNIFGVMATNLTIRAYEDSMKRLNAALDAFDRTQRSGVSGQTNSLIQFNQNWGNLSEQLDEIERGERETLEEFTARIEDQLVGLGDIEQEFEDEKLRRRELAKKFLPVPAQTSSKKTQRRSTSGSTQRGGLCVYHGRNYSIGQTVGSDRTGMVDLYALVSRGSHPYGRSGRAFQCQCTSSGWQCI